MSRASVNRRKEREEDVLVVDAGTRDRRQTHHRVQRWLALLIAGSLFAAACPATLAAAAPAAHNGGITLDGYGGLHVFGGAAVNTAGSPYWSGWDIARAVAVRSDGTGGWTLDGYGGTHSWGAAAAITAPSYWPGWDIARDFVVTSKDSSGILDGRQGYVLDGLGGLHAWGGAPPLPGPYPGTDVARGLSIHVDSAGVPDGGWTLYKDGTIHAFGVAAAVALTLPRDDVFQKLHTSGPATSGYVVARWGVITTWGNGISPYWSGYTDWGTWNILRDIVLLGANNPTATPQPSSAAAASLYQATMQPHGGVILDAYGGLHLMAGMSVNTSGSPYWQGWDIARSVAVREDGSGGWTLDGYGGIHAWGTAPPITPPTYWQGWDIARAMVVTSKTNAGISDGAQGYLLDGYGGIHPWGGAPAIGAPPYLPVFDTYRGLAIHYTAGGVPDGGWALDVLGRTFAFGAAPTLGNILGETFRPVFHSLHATPFGTYAVQRDGVLTTVSGYVSAYWGGWTDWGAWDIVRDVALLNPVDPDTATQPLSSDAQADYSNHLTGRYMLAAPMDRQQHPLDCEAASMQMALAAKGFNLSQDDALNFWGADLRASARDSAGNILQWGDPYVSFVGNVNASEWNATGYGVYYPPLVRLAQTVGANAIGQEGWDVNLLYGLVAAGYPAAVEYSYDTHAASPRTWTAWDGRQVTYMLNDHVVTLVGVDFGRQAVIVNDPYSGTVKSFSFADFQRSFGYLNNMATVVG